MTRPSTVSPRRRRRRRREERSTGGNWSDLPDGPLHTILTCLCSFVDFVSFSSVCRSWRAVASSLPASLVTSLYPPLILCPSFTVGRYFASLRLLDPASSSFSSSLSRTFPKFWYFRFPKFLQGHLLRFSEENRYVIVNPFTGHEVVSPVVPKDPKIRYAPILLTSPLSSADSTLILFAADVLVYWHIRSPVSQAWSSHYPRIKPNGEARIATVQGKVYVMDSADTLFVLDLSPELHLRQIAVEGIAEMNFSLQSFLVDCGGELLHLLLVPTEEMVSARLEVFQLDFSMDRTRWVKKKILGNWAIFVGHTNRVSGLAVENPERWGGKSNCVYFAKGDRNGDEPWLVIKLGDEIDIVGSQSPLHQGKYEHWLSSAWVRPGF